MNSRTIIDRAGDWFIASSRGCDCPRVKRVKLLHRFQRGWAQRFFSREKLWER